MPAPPGTLSYRTTPHSLPSLSSRHRQQAHFARIEPEDPAPPRNSPQRSRVTAPGRVGRVWARRKPNSASQPSVHLPRNQHLEAVDRWALVHPACGRCAGVIIASGACESKSPGSVFEPRGPAFVPLAVGIPTNRRQTAKPRSYSPRLTTSNSPSGRYVRSNCGSHEARRLSRFDRHPRGKAERHGLGRVDTLDLGATHRRFRSRGAETVFDQQQRLIGLFAVRSRCKRGTPARTGEAIEPMLVRCKRIAAPSGRGEVSPCQLLIRPRR